MLHCVSFSRHNASNVLIGPPARNPIGIGRYTTNFSLKDIVMMVCWIMTAYIFPFRSVEPMLRCLPALGTHPARTFSMCPKTRLRTPIMAHVMRRTPGKIGYNVMNEWEKTYLSIEASYAESPV